MNYREMNYIVTIAKEGNISRAAERLFITQPALSRTLAAVEKELGASIFERHGKYVVPTPVGSIYLEYAERILHLETQMNNSLQNTIQKSKEHVQIAVPMMYADIMSHSVFPEFNKKYPFVAINIYICGSSDIKESILSGKYPLGLAIIREDLPDLFIYNIVGQQEMVVVVNANHPLLHEAVIKEGRSYPCVTAEQLSGYPFALSAEVNHSHQFAKEYFDEHGMSPLIICQVPYTGYLYTVVSQGNCIALAPDIPLDGMDNKLNVRYLCLDDVCHLDTLAVIRTQEHKITEYENYLIGTIRKHLRHTGLPE